MPFAMPPEAWPGAPMPVFGAGGANKHDTNDHYASNNDASTPFATTTNLELA